VFAPGRRVRVHFTCTDNGVVVHESWLPVIPSMMPVSRPQGPPSIVAVVWLGLIRMVLVRRAPLSPVQVPAKGRAGVGVDLTAVRCLELFSAFAVCDFGCTEIFDFDLVGLLGAGVGLSGAS